jgi:hypothetical protein
MSIAERVIGIAVVIIIGGVFIISAYILGGIFKKYLQKWVNPLKKFHKNPKSTVLTTTEQNALNVGAIMAEFNMDFYDSLQTSKLRAIGTVKNLLSEWWEISSQETAVETLDNLKNNLHRQIFNSILKDATMVLSPIHQFENRQQVYDHLGFTVLDKEITEKYADAIALVAKHIDKLFKVSSDEEFAQIRSLFGDDEMCNLCVHIYNMLLDKYESYVRYINNLKQTLPELQKQGFVGDISELTQINATAWDMGRLVNVARYSFDCEYIPESKAWEYIFHAQKLSASCYADWASFGKAYIIGRAMWGGEGLSLSVMMDTVKELQKNVKSPWVLAPLK